MHAVILAAGLGTRLLPHTQSRPKGMVPLAGRPLLEHTFGMLPDEVTEVVMVIGHLGSQVQEYFGGEWYGRKISYVTQNPLNGTGGALHAARRAVRGKFLVINGDDLYAKDDLQRLIVHPLGLLAAEAGHPVPESVVVGENGRFLGLAADRDNNQGLVCAGAYVLDESFFNFPLVQIRGRGSVEYGLPHTIALRASEEEIYVERATWWHQVGTLEQYEKAQELAVSLRGSGQL